MTRPSTLLLLLTTLAAPAGAAAASPPATGDGWRVSSPQQQGLDPAALDAMAHRIRTETVFDHAYALLVARHGELVFEEAFNGRNREQRSDVRSVTKSVVSLLLGIARQEGRLPRSLQTPLRQLVPQRLAGLLDDDKAAITFEHALTMQAGLRWEENVDPWFTHMLEHPDLAAYTLGEPLATAPGTTFNYSTGLSHVLGRVVAARTGRSLPEYAQSRLFGPLGFRNTGWLARANGEHNGGFGLEIRPRDMAKLGQLALQDGNWAGRQVVPAAWLRAATREQTADGSRYGFQWWAPADGELVALGYGGQYVWADRDLDVVVVLQANWFVPFERHIGWTAFYRLLDELRGGLRPEQRGTVRPISSGELAAGEGDGVLRVEIERSPGETGGADGSAEIAWRTVNGSARSRVDFQARSGSMVWGPGETGSRWVEIPLVDDALEEPPESFQLVLTRLSGVDALEGGALTLTLVDDDDAAPPRVVAVDTPTAVAAEGEAVAFALSRTDGAGALEVSWTARPIRGSEEDLVASSGTATFAAGSLTTELEVRSRLDGEGEEPEMFEIALAVSEPGVAMDDAADSAVLAVLDDAPGGPCSPQTALCLHQGRFRVRGLWRVPGSNGADGEVGTARGAALSEESGWFWFFRPDSLELLLKVLDGRTLNDSWWVFYGALTDVEALLVVEDLAAGAARLYRSRPGGLCGAADTSAFPGGPALEPAAARAFGDGLQAPSERFTVDVEWTDPRSGASGTATSRRLTDETSLQWFFAPGNFEMATKILDGTGINGHYWVFAGALTDVDFRLTVTDRETGATRSYHSGEPLCGIADVEAFPP